MKLNDPHLLICFNIGTGVGLGASTCPELGRSLMGAGLGVFS